MFTKKYSMSDPYSGAITTARRSCVIHVPNVHRLTAAHLYAQKVVYTGTVTVCLRYRDRNGPQNGAQIGVELDNPTLGNEVTNNQRLDFVLSPSEKVSAPADRQYFLLITGTNAADRVDEPILVLEVEE